MALKFPHLVGTYQLGPENVRLFVTDAKSGASFDCRPADKGCARLDIGIMNPSWSYCVGSLLHEAMEHTMHREGCGHKRTRDWTDATDTFLFVMNHLTFDRCVAVVAMFMIDCMADFGVAWKKSNKIKDPT